MIDPQQLERRPNCVVGLSSQCCSRHAGKNGLLCAVLLLGSLAHLVSQVSCVPPLGLPETPFFLLPVDLGTC